MKDANTLEMVMEIVNRHHPVNICMGVDILSVMKGVESRAMALNQQAKKTEDSRVRKMVRKGEPPPTTGNPDSVRNLQSYGSNTTTVATLRNQADESHQGMVMYWADGSDLWVSPATTDGDRMSIAQIGISEALRWYVEEDTDKVPCKKDMKATFLSEGQNAPDELETPASAVKTAELEASIPVYDKVFPWNYSLLLDPDTNLPLGGPMRNSIFVIVSSSYAIDQNGNRSELSEDAIIFNRILRAAKYLEKSRKCVLLLQHSGSIPPDIKLISRCFKIKGPTKAIVEGVVKTSLNNNLKGGNCSDSEAGQLMIDSVCKRLEGVSTMQEVNLLLKGSLYSASIKRKHEPTANPADVFDLEYIEEQRILMMLDTKGLSMAIPKFDLDEVGGYDVASDYIRSLPKLMSQEARGDGMCNPKGILLVGPGGTGKSALAEAAAKSLDMPLVIFDPGSSKGSLVGQSEKNFRRALEQINKIGRAVVLVDEFEKMWAGAGRGLDSGVSEALLGRWLQWMQNEKSENIIVIAACNDIRGLPGPIVRARRFDEIFMMGLPGPKAREAILRIHLRKCGWIAACDKDDIIISDVVAVTHGYSGAELESVVQKAISNKIMRRGCGRDIPLNTSDLLVGASNVIPLAKTHAMEIVDLENWARVSGVRNASSEQPDFSFSESGTMNIMVSSEVRSKKKKKASSTEKAISSLEDFYDDTSADGQDNV